MKNNFFLLFLLLTLHVHGQELQPASQEVDVNQFVKGTLLDPKTGDKGSLVILVPGSGPVDRNGNQAFMKNDGLKKLALGLAENGIASYRFDKRILQMGQLGIQEKDVRFDNFVTDVVAVLDHFQQTGDYDDLIVLGHSQGSLVGMIAAKDRADAFISIAGVATPIDAVIVQQIADQMPGLKENAQQSFRELSESGSTTSYDPMLEMIFRPSVQPFILSWMQYKPQEEIKKLEIPVLLVNGTKDLQVKPEEAEKLKAAYPEAELILLENMNHVFRKIEGDDLENSKSYNNAQLPLHPALIPAIVRFIKEVE